jgi:hypothetical protein
VGCWRYVHFIAFLSLASFACAVDILLPVIIIPCTYTHILRTILPNPHSHSESSSNYVSSIYDTTHLRASSPSSSSLLSLFSILRLYYFPTTLNSSLQNVVQKITSAQSTNIISSIVHYYCITSGADGLGCVFLLSFFFVLFFLLLEGDSIHRFGF